MEPRYCIYNRTTDRFLSVGTVVVDTAIEPFESVELPADGENVTADWGLCVIPAQSFSAERFSFPIGVVYLDADRRVLECFEWAPGEEWPDEAGTDAVSMLAMPSQSVVSSRTHPGDQLILCAAEELVRHLARVPSVKNGRSAAPSAGEDAISRDEPLVTTVTEKKAKNGRRAAKPEAAPPRILEINEGANASPRASAASMSLDAWHIGESYQMGSSNGIETRQTDLQSDEIESVVSQVLQWSRPGDAKPPALSIADRPLMMDWSPRMQEPLSSMEMLEEESEGDIEMEDEGEEQLPAIETLSETEELAASHQEPARSEFDRFEIESVVSQVLQWAEQTGRPVARASESAVQLPHALEGLNSNQREGQNPREAVNGNGTPVTGRKGSGATHHVRSRFGRWADEITNPLTQGLKSKPVVRIKIRTRSSPVRKKGRDEQFGSQNSRLGAVFQKFKENGKGFLSADGIHTLKAKFTKWLDEDPGKTKTVGPVDRRRSSRHTLPDLIAYYWTGGTPQAHRVSDISCNGFYLLTDERWVPETVIRMTLQRTGHGGPNQEEAISVLSKVVRSGKDGVGHEFILSDSVNMRSGRHTSGKEKVKEALQEFI